MKSTEARVSERFRNKLPFSQHIIAKAENSIIRFSTARSLAQPYRYNKASLLSFLMFFSRFEDEEVTLSFIQDFIEITKSKSSTYHLSEAAALFDDRASLRVTDVSSVVYRDFSLWYMYFFLYRSEVPASIPVDTIRDVGRDLATRRGATFESCVAQLVNVETWAATL